MNTIGMDLSPPPASSCPSSSSHTSPRTSSYTSSPPSHPSPTTTPPFTHPPPTSLPASAELEYLTHTAFLAIQARPVPAWMRAHIASNFRSDIDALSSPTWDEHVSKFRALGLERPARHRITNLIADVDEAKAHADVLCHMEATSVPAGITRLGLAQLRWKRHPLDGRWQLVHILGMREPPGGLHGDVSGEGGGGVEMEGNGRGR